MIAVAAARCQSAFRGRVASWAALGLVPADPWRPLLRFPRLIAFHFAAVAALAAVLGACGPGGASGPATVTPTGAPPASGSATSAPSAAPSVAGGASPSSALALPHDDPALEAELPDEFGGARLFKLSVGPISSAGNQGAEPIRTLADQIGDGTGNFSLAFANDPAAPTYNLFALRVPGADSNELLEEYTGLTVADAAGSETDQVSIGGKSVIRVTAPNNPIGDVWFYAIQDTIFGVQAGSEADATELIELLP